MTFFLLAARVYAQIIKKIDMGVPIEDAIADYKPFTKGLWHEVVVAPEEENPVEFKNMLHQLLVDSLQLLKDFFPKRKELEFLYTEEFYAQIIGGFEMNNLSVVVDSPLKWHLISLSKKDGNPELKRGLARLSLILHELRDRELREQEDGEGEEDGEDGEDREDETHASKGKEKEKKTKIELKESLQDSKKEEKMGASHHHHKKHSNSSHSEATVDNSCCNEKGEGENCCEQKEGEEGHSCHDEDCDCDCEEELDPEDVLGFNQLGLDMDGTGLYVIGCTLNHSCHPNVVNLKGPVDVDGRGVFMTTRPIKVGEELTMSYIEEEANFEERRKELRDYAFICHCEKCLQDEKDQK